MVKMCNNRDCCCCLFHRQTFQSNKMLSTDDIGMVGDKFKVLVTDLYRFQVKREDHRKEVNMKYQIKSISS